MKISVLSLVLIFCFTVVESGLRERIAAARAKAAAKRAGEGEGNPVLKAIIEKAIQCRKDNADDVANVNGDLIKEVVLRWKDQTQFKLEDDSEQGALIRKAIAAYKNRVDGVQAAWDDGSEEGNKIKAAVDRLAKVVICLKQAAVEKIKDAADGGSADGAGWAKIKAIGAFLKNKKDAAAENAAVPA